MFKAKRRTVVTVTAVAAVLLGGALAATLLTSGNGSAVGNTVRYPAGQRPLAPDITGKSLTGTAINLASYRGQTVVLNFWASWCSPCRDEASTLVALEQQYRSKGVAFLGDDVGDTPTNALAFSRSVGVTYPSISDPGYTAVAQLGQAVSVHETPTTVVIDKTGHIAGTILGPVTYNGLTTLLHEAAVTK